MPISAITKGEYAGPIRRPAIVISGRDIDQEELVDEVLEFRNRLRRVHADTKLCAALEAFRIPGAQRADLVDHPSLLADRFSLGVSVAGSAVAKPCGFVHILCQQQVHVIEQEPSALLV